MTKDLNKAAFDEEHDFGDDVEKVMEYIDNTNDAESLDALEQVLTEDDDINLEKAIVAQISSTSSEKKEEIEPTKDEEGGDKPPETSTEKGDGSKKETDESTISTETSETGEKSGEKKVFLIDDEFISKAPEADRNLLTPLKGETISEKGLKILLDSQRHIGHLNNELGTLKKQKAEEVDLGDRQPLTDNLVKVKNDMVFESLSTKYPGLIDMDGQPIPLDKNDPRYKEFLRDLNNDDPEAFQEFFTDRKTFEAEAERNIRQAVKIQNEYPQLNETTLIDDIQGIKTMLKDVYNIESSEDLQALGFSFDLTKTEEGKLNNKFIVDLLLNDQKNATDRTLYNIIGTKNQIPLLKKGAVSQKFFERYNPQIIQYVRQRAVTEGFKKAHEKKKELNPSLSDTNQSGKGVKAMTLDQILNSNNSRTLENAIAEMEK